MAALKESRRCPPRGGAGKRGSRRSSGLGEAVERAHVTMAPGVPCDLVENHINLNDVFLPEIICELRL